MKVHQKICWNKNKHFPKQLELVLHMILFVARQFTNGFCNFWDPRKKLQCVRTCFFFVQCIPTSLACTAFFREKGQGWRSVVLRTICIFISSRKMCGEPCWGLQNQIKITARQNLMEKDSSMMVPLTTHPWISAMQTVYVFFCSPLTYTTTVRGAEGGGECYLDWYERERGWWKVLRTPVFLHDSRTCTLWHMWCGVRVGSFLDMWYLPPNRWVALVVWSGCQRKTIVYHQTVEDF